MNYKKKLIAKSTKGSTKNLIKNLKFLMESSIFLPQYLKIIQYVYQLKKMLTILVALFKFIRGNLMEYQKKYN